LSAATALARSRQRAGAQAWGLLALAAALAVLRAVESAKAVAGGATPVLSADKLARARAVAADKAERGGAWLAQHMQWDFDDVDPIMPLSPFFRFDHAIKSKYLLPLGQETIRFSTTVRPTGRRGWVTTTVNPFRWLQVQSTVFSQGLKAPCAVSSAEVVLPLEKMTLQADDMLNRGLDTAQQGALGRTVVGGVRTQVLVGASTREEPWIGVETDTRISLSESKRPLRLRTRVTCNTDKQVTALCAPCCVRVRCMCARGRMCARACCFLPCCTSLASGMDRGRAASEEMRWRRPC
jgi:hypothetical protein